MLGFIGKIISGIAIKIIVLVAMVVGGRYAFMQVGGVPGIMALAQGQPLPAATSPQPISAGIGGIMTSLGLGGGDSAPKDYFEQQGRISKISIECRLEKIANGKMTRTEPLSCSRASMALSYPQFEGYTLSKARTATYIYYGMDGVSTMTGAADAKPGQKVGDVINLRVNRVYPAKSTPI